MTQPSIFHKIGDASDPLSPSWAGPTGSYQPAHNQAIIGQGGGGPLRIGKIGYECVIEGVITLPTETDVLLFEIFDARFKPKNPWVHFQPATIQSWAVNYRNVTTNTFVIPDFRFPASVRVTMPVEVPAPETANSLFIYHRFETAYLDESW